MDNFTKRLIILLLIAASFLPCLASGASSESFTNALYPGQNKMYTVDIPCSGEVVINGPDGIELFLYAKKADSSWTPSASYVMQYSDVSSTKPGSSQMLFLDSGKWFIVVESQKGFGEFSMSVKKSCPMTTGCMGLPCSNIRDCIIPTIFTDDVQTGYLRTGESKTYSYKIPGNRSYVEWILNGPCDNDIPELKTKANLNDFVSKNCGVDFDLYIYKACNPKYYPCTAFAADIGQGSNAYIGVSGPDPDVLYYVKIFSKHGRGDYQLTARSYADKDITIAGIEPAEYSGVIASDENVTAPDDLTQSVPIPPTAYTERPVEL